MDVGTNEPRLQLKASTHYDSTNGWDVPGKGPTCRSKVAVLCTDSSQLGTNGRFEQPLSASLGQLFCVSSALDFETTLGWF